MLGGFLVGAIAGGLVVWKYRDSFREYVKGNAGPAREKVDGLLRTVQQRSETLLDQAKEQLSSRFESTREKVHPGTSAADRGRPTE
jgi:cell division septum initiation protein DivIVA